MAISLQRTIGVALTAFAISASVASAAPSPDVTIVGTPRLYAVQEQHGLGRPVAYVVFSSSRHLHEPRQVFASVAGKAGRTYASRFGGDRCYRVSFINENADGKPIPFLKAGRTYAVQFRGRATVASPSHVITTTALTARPRPASFPIPSC
ncbi:MAG TPA: hypothetical protein VHZ75_10120 [Solirubrobacteraceae bacterium]|jgi:hypothetical protein|nr:hypothetical protein [Solirubrobacteraceae bacterium]